MFCPNCGRELPLESHFCPGCGKDMTRGARPEPPSAGAAGTSPCNRFIYLLLAFFLGTFGIHNFYAKRITRGLIQLLLTLFSCGFAGILVFFWVIWDMLFVATDGDGRKMEGGQAAAIVIAILAFLGFLVFLLVLGAICFIGYNSYERKTADNCMEHLQAIGEALEKYAATHGDRYPIQNNNAGLTALLPELRNSNQLVCPSGDGSTGYIYLAGAETGNGEYPVAFDVPGNHKGMAHVLYADGRVNLVSCPADAATVRGFIKHLKEAATDPAVKKFFEKKAEEF